VTLDDFLTILALRPAHLCMSRPVPVTRTRFFVPLWVFIFGILVPWFGLSGARLCPARSGGPVHQSLGSRSHQDPWGVPLPGGALLSVRGLRRAVLPLSSRALGALSLAESTTLSGPPGLVGLDLSPSLRLPLVRRDDHDHVAAILPRLGFDIPQIRDVLGPTDPSKAPPGSIRREFGSNIMVNAAHASDSVESARREMGIIKLGQENMFAKVVEEFYGGL